MKAAAVFPQKKSLGVVNDFPAPKIEDPTSLKLRILTVGVCGTDREIASFDYGEPPAGYDYLVLGHETVGEVVEIGPEVQHFKPGDLAIPMVRRPCNHPDCVACRSGRQDFCYTGDYKERGIKEMHGFMTELVVDEAIYMNAVPQAVRDVAVLVEPLTIAEKGLIQALQIQERMPWACARPEGVVANGAPQNGPKPAACRAVVLGAGPVGLLGAMALKHGGFDVWVYSREREPSISSDITHKIGAKYISSEEKSIAEMAAQVGNIDIVYEATGASRLAFEVLEALGTNGLFILTGVPGRHGPVGIDTARIMRNMVLKNQCLLGTVNAGKDAFERAISDLTGFYARWPDAVKALITGRFPLDDFVEPIEKPSGIKNVVQIAQ